MSARRLEPEVRSCPDVNLLNPLPPIETYQPGVRLTSQGEVAACVYFVVQGVVKLLHVYPDGREGIVELAAGGDLVGVHSAALGQACLETAVTLTQCRLARWRASEFLARLEREAGFSADVCRIVCGQVRALRHRFLELASQPARMRLEALLEFWFHRGPGGCQHPSRPFVLPLTREELGQLLCVSPSHVSRLTAVLVQAGILWGRKGGIRVRSAALRGAAANRG